MRELSIDLETYSGASLKDEGLYNYIDSPDFEVLLFAYSVDGGPVQVVDVAGGEEIPEGVLLALTDPEVTKTAFNAMFERLCLNRYTGTETGPWTCTMIKAWTLGIGGGLAGVGKALGLEQQKLKEGKSLIKKFCAPRKPTKSNPATRIYPADDPEAWSLFKEYNRVDVEVELAIRDRLNRFDLHPMEEALYELDQRINDRGIRIDQEMVHNAIRIDQEQTRVATEAFQRVTGLDNPNSLPAIKALIRERTGEDVQSITKSNTDELRERFGGYPAVATALEMRQVLSRTSTAKFPRMLQIMSPDGRARGNIQHYGAYQTGRWAGRGIQVHNLPRNHVKDLETARRVVKEGDYDLMTMLYDDPGDILSQCIRPCIVPDAGKKFFVADFSAIEARVVAWLAGESWVLEVFEGDGRIYEAAASRMFGVPLASIGKGSDLRQRGKVATLALGYQGGPGALVSMGALKMGIAEEDLQEIVDRWRRANSRIVRLWYRTQDAVKEAIRERTTVKINAYLTAVYRSDMLFIELPSGRRLAYPKARLIDHPTWAGAEQIVYGKMNAAGTGWLTEETYGGKLVENIVQATARDCLGEAMLAVEAAGYEIVMHVHDELIAEVDADDDSLDSLCEIMGRALPWAPGLPLRADGYECDYYKKD